MDISLNIGIDDFIIEDSTSQDTEILIYSNKGMLPLDLNKGCNITQNISAPVSKLSEIDIKQQCKDEGINVDSIAYNYNSGTLEISIS